MSAFIHADSHHFNNNHLTICIDGDCRDFLQAWIVKKKGQMRQKGKVDVAPDTKYTGRKRKDRF